MSRFSKMVGFFLRISRFRSSNSFAFSKSKSLTLRKRRSNSLSVSINERTIDNEKTIAKTRLLMTFDVKVERH